MITTPNIPICYFYEQKNDSGKRISSNDKWIILSWGRQLTYQLQIIFLFLRGVIDRCLAYSRDKNHAWNKWHKRSLTHGWHRGLAGVLSINPTSIVQWNLIYRHLKEWRRGWRCGELKWKKALTLSSVIGIFD